MRLAVGIEYAGTRFAGWQRQASVPSVQAVVEEALGAVADHPVALTAAGRTDAGVHALGQVAHFDTAAERPLRGWLLGANTILPSEVALTFVASVAEDFHARYAAIERTYRYLIVNRAARPPLAYERAAWRHIPLDEGRMQAALEALIGEHDFSAFRAAECQSRVPIRDLRRVSVRRQGDLVSVEVTANAFLHHMVRNLVGSALEVGEGARPVEWLAEVLASRDRRQAGPTAPAGGLYFARVAYPERYRVPPPVGYGLSVMIGAGRLGEGGG